MREKIFLCFIIFSLNLSCFADDKLAGIIATIGDSAISTLDVYSNEKLLFLFGELNPSVSKGEIKKQALDNLITEMAIIEHGVKNEINVRTNEIEDTISRIALGLGKKTTEEFYKYIEGEQISKEILKNKIKAHLILKKIIESNQEQKIGKKEIKSFVQKMQNSQNQKQSEIVYKLRYLEINTASSIEDNIKNFEKLSYFSEKIKNCEEITKASNYGISPKIVTESFEIKESDLNDVFRSAIIRMKEGSLSSVFANNQKIGLIAICEKKMSAIQFQKNKKLSDEEALSMLTKQKRSELAQSLVRKIKGSSSIQIKNQEREP